MDIQEKAQVLTDAIIADYTRNPAAVHYHVPTAADRRATRLFWMLRIEPADARKILHNPEFGRQTKIHDYRNYIPDAIREIWQELPTDARAALFFQADKYSEQWTGEDDEY